MHGNFSKRKGENKHPLIAGAAEENMEIKQIKRLAVVIMGMISVMLSWAVFWPANLCLPSNLINPFNASDTLIMFAVCNIIIVTITINAHLSQVPRNSNEVTAFKFSSREEFGQAYCQNNKVISAGLFREQETPKSTEKMKFIFRAEDAGAEAKYSPSNFGTVGCSRDNYMGIWDEDLKDNFLCTSVPHEVMQVVDVPAVIESKNYSEIAPMIDEDLKRRVEEFIAKFKRQLCLERQQSLSLRRFQLALTDDIE